VADIGTRERSCSEAADPAPRKFLLASFVEAVSFSFSLLIHFPFSLAIALVVYPENLAHGICVRFRRLVLRIMG
jgi:hypothetical protein